MCILFEDEHESFFYCSTYKDKMSFHVVLKSRFEKLVYTVYSIASSTLDIRLQIKN